MAVGTTAFPTALDTAVELVEAANNASTTLNGTLTIGATTITVSSTSLFPSSGLITIESEIISYTGTTATTFTGCTRGVDGTSAASHADTTDVYGYYTSLHHEALRGAIIAVETKLGYGSSTSTANTVLLGNGTGTSAWGAITNAYIDASAAIAHSKMAALTASRLMVTDASGFASASSVTSTEAGYLSGVTSAIQTQIDGKQAAFSYAGPATGAAAAPAFRSLVAADIPDLSAIYALLGHDHDGDYQPIDQDLTDIATLTGDGLLRRSSNVWAMDSAAYLTGNQTITLSGDVSGSGATSISVTIGAGKVTNAMLAGSIAISKLSITGTPDGSKFLRDDGSWQVPGGGGTVTSVGLSLPAIFTVSGSPVTGAGTLTGDLADQVANTVFAGPETGADDTPAFRALVAADIPDLSASYSVVGHNHSGVYEPANANIQSHIASTSNPHSVTKSQIGLGNVENTAISTWAGSANITTVGTITSGGLGTGAVIGGVTMTLGSDADGDIYYRSSNVLTRLPKGTALQRLRMNAGATAPEWFTDSGGGLTVDTTAIASGTAGTILYQTSGNVLGEIAGSSVTANGAISFTPTARTSGSPALPFAQFLSAADTGLGNVEQIAFQFGGDASQATVTRTLTGGGGAIALWRNALFVAPTIAASASQTITQSGTVAIAGPPIAGTNITLTSPTALLIRTNRSDQSSIRLDGSSGNTYNSIDYVTSARTFSLTGSANTWYLLDRGSGTFPFYVDAGSSYPRMGIGTNAIDTSTHLRVLSSSASRVGLRVDSASSPSVPIFEVRVNGTADTALEVDGDSTAGNTRLLIYDVDNATLERVSVGAADSGGSGFKVLRIPN